MNVCFLLICYCLGTLCVFLLTARKFRVCWPIAAEEQTKRNSTMSQPIIIIADQALAVQAQLGDLLAAEADTVSVIRQEQLDYWLSEPSHTPDLLILQRDFTEDMPALLNRWRSHPQTRHCDVLLMGEADERFEVEALLSGAVDYVRKPINPVLVLARVKAQLGRRLEVARLEALSTTDSLTNIANRRYLDRFLAAEWGRAQREAGNLGLIMIDIDHFKQYNDFYGHPAGDDVLTRVAAALKSCAQRPRDLVARYGGEEFAVVLPSIQLEGLEVVAKRLQQTINDLRIEHHGSLTAPHLTLSQGLAWSEPKAGEDWHLLLEAADEALYTAKSAGRDQFSETVDLAAVRLLVPG